MGTVYRITHKASGTTYVGSTGNVKQRWRDHKSRLRRGAHDNPHLQYAYNKYGADAFEWAIIEDNLAEEDLIAHEQSFLDEFKERGEVYNCGECVANALRGRPSWSAGVKRGPQSDEHKRLISEALMGREVSKEAKRKISKAMRGQQHALGYHHTEDARHRIGQALANPYPAFIHQETKEIIPPGINLSMLCRDRGLHHGHMWCVVHGHHKSHKGWRLANGEEPFNT